MYILTLYKFLVQHISLIGTKQNMQYIMHLEKLCLYFIHVSYLIIACIVAVWIPLKTANYAGKSYK